MALRRLLVISPLFHVNAPQPARFRELVRRWSDRFEVIVVAFDTGGSQPVSADGAGISLMQFSPAGRLLIGSRLKSHGQDNETTRKGGEQNPAEAVNSGSETDPGRFPETDPGRFSETDPGRFSEKDPGRFSGGISRGSTGGLLRRLARQVHINRFFFPDVFLVEYRNIRRHVLSLAGQLKPEAVIISVAPFTLMFLATALKKKFPQIKVVIDAGDPFHGDSSTYSRRLSHRLFSRRVERHGLAKADMIVVPTSIMKKHYLATYGEVVSGDRIRVIENGINELFASIADPKAGSSIPFRMVYAGRFYEKMRDPSELYRAVNEFPAGEVMLKVFGNIQEKFLPPAQDIRFIAGGAVDARTLAREYEEADLVIYLDNAYGVQVPGKVYEVLAVNRPVLYICRNEASPSYDIVNGMDGVVMVTNDHRSIAEGIARVMREYAGRSFRRGSERYTFDALASSYGILLEELISRTGQTG